MQLKGLHDRLLEEVPEGANHDSDTCPLCAVDPTTAHEETPREEPGGGTRMKTYTEEELQAAVDAAVTRAKAELDAKVKELTAQAQESEVEARIEAAKAEAQVQVDDLQTKLDAAVLEAANEKKVREDLEAFLATAEAEAAEKATIEARRDDRLSKIREAASFDEEYLKANSDRFAAMSDEDFEARLGEWREISSRGTRAVPEKTALTAARDGADPRARGSMTDVRELMSLRFDGVDTRTA